MSTRLGNNAKPTSTLEAWQGLYEATAIPLTLPSGGPWNIVRLGAWLAGFGDAVDTKLVLWSQGGSILKSSATFSAAGQSFAVGQVTSYEQNITAHQVNGGTTVYVGFSTTPGDGYQFGRYASGNHLDDDQPALPSDLTGNDAHNGVGAASCWLYYEAANQPPIAPFLSAPIGGALVASQTPTLGFVPLDPNADTHTGYTYQVDNNSDFSSPVESTEVNGSFPNNVGINRVVVSTLSRGTTYFWRVKTKDAVGYGPYSAGESFKIGSLPTASVTTPANGHTARLWYTAGTSTTPKIQVHWSFSDTDGHSQTHSRVFIYADSAGSPGSQVYDSGWQSNSSTSFQTTYAATNGTFYHVSVQVRCSLTLESVESSKNRTRVRWGRASYYYNVGSTPTTVSVGNGQSVSGNQALVLEYTMTGSTTEPTTWYSNISTPGLNQYLWHRVTMWGWGSATPTSPSLNDLTWTYGTVGLALDDWNVASGATVDTGAFWFGTQSLKHACNGAEQRSFQVVSVVPGTTLILQGRIKALNNPQAKYRVLDATGTTEIVATSTVSTTQDFTKYVSATFETGSNSQLRVECYTNAAGGNTAWFDVPKLEEGTVATPWNPGFIGGATVDSGGLAVDATKGATFRLRGSDVGGQALITLGQSGLDFQSDVSSDSAITTRVVGDSDPRFIIEEDGDHRWGPGNAATDVTLSRLSAGTGLVLQPSARFEYQSPSVVATRTTTQAITTSTWTPVEYTATDIHDPFSMHDPGTNPSRFTVPTNMAGLYLCWASVSFTGNATNTRLLHMSINNSTPGSTVRAVQATGDATHQQGMNVLFIQELDDGDFVEFEVWQDSGADLNVGANAFAGILYVGNQ